MFEKVRIGLRKIGEEAYRVWNSAKIHGQETDLLYSVKPECMCHFPGCGKQFRWGYLQDGSLYERTSFEMWPFLTNKNFTAIKNALFNARAYVKEAARDAYVESNIVLKACEDHVLENCAWSRERRRKLLNRKA